MPRPHVYRTEALVLRRTDFAEADRLVTLYAPELGKLRVLAKGSRRPGSKLAGHVELFCHCSLLIAVGRNLDLIIQAQTISSFAPLRADLDLIAAAHYLAEFVDAFTAERIENQPLFTLLRGSLAMLAHARSPEILLRFFELHGLRLLGYDSEMERCVRCGREAAEAALSAFSAYAGGALCADCARQEAPVIPVSPAALEVLGSLQARDAGIVNCLHVPPSVAREAAAVLRYHIRYVLEHDLKSSEFLNSLRPRAPQPLEVTVAAPKP